MRNSFILVCISMLVMGAACEPQSGALSPSEIPGWRLQIQQKRAEKDHAFKTDPTSPMACIARWTLPADRPATIATGPDGLIQAADGGTPLLTVRYHDNHWQWTAQAVGVRATLDGKPVQRPFVTTGMTFHLNSRFTLQAYPDTDTLTLLVFDANRPESKSFTGLTYFEPDPAYVVTARLEKLPAPETVPMTTSRNLEKNYLRYAILHFHLNGKPYRLTAYKMHLKGPYAHLLFIPFRDATSSTETYGAGRYLELDEPTGTMLRLDFNLAFNPLCNYSPGYNCPLPPPENTLPIPIRAGEKIYPVHHGPDTP